MLYQWKFRWAVFALQFSAASLLHPVRTTTCPMGKLNTGPDRRKSSHFGKVSDRRDEILVLNYRVCTSCDVSRKTDGSCLSNDCWGHARCRSRNCPNTRHSKTKQKIFMTELLRYNYLMPTCVSYTINRYGSNACNGTYGVDCPVAMKLAIHSPVPGPSNIPQQECPVAMYRPLLLPFSSGWGT